MTLISDSPFKKNQYLKMQNHISYVLIFTFKLYILSFKVRFKIVIERKLTEVQENYF